MRDPLRLVDAHMRRDGGQSIEAMLLSAALRDNPSAEDRAQVLSAIGLGAAATTALATAATRAMTEMAGMTAMATSGGAKAVAGAALSKSMGVVVAGAWVKWVGIAMFAGAVGVGAVKGVQVALSAAPSTRLDTGRAAARVSTSDHLEHQALSRGGDMAAAPTADPLAAATTAKQHPDPVPRVSLGVAAPRPAVPGSRIVRVSTSTTSLPSTVVRPSAVVVESTSLADETASAEALRGLIRSREFANALVAANVHRDRFPLGLLAQEMLVLRMEALYGLGDRAALLPIAHAFVASTPGSPHARRVRIILDAVEAETSKRE